MTIEAYAAYLLAAFVVIAVPGPNVTLILATSAQRGMLSGVAVLLGVAAAMTLQVAFVTLGLTWLVQRFSEIFEVIRYLGAAYLIWLGYQAWKSAGAVRDEKAGGAVMWRKGFLVGLANPKSLTFFAAFFPQFMNPALPSGPQLALLASSFIILALFVNIGYAFTGSMGHRFSANGGFQRFLGRSSGLLLMGGGVVLAGLRRN